MMMTSVFSDDLGDFSAVYDDAELVSVQRPQSSAAALATRAEAWLESGGMIETQWSQSNEQASIAERMLSPIDDAELRAGLGEEIAAGVEVLTDLLSCGEVGIRVATLQGPMCPRFHTDLVPCRMLLTLVGPGTEWIAHNDVDVDRFADRSEQQPPVRVGGRIQTLSPGAWSLMKGGRWDERFHGVVHRSPHRELRRLLITFDPMFRA